MSLDLSKKGIDVSRDYKVEDFIRMSGEELKQVLKSIDAEFNNIHTGIKESFSLHQPGAKDDGDKPRMALVLGAFSDSLWSVAEVGTMGARKYTDNGWRSVPNPHERYISAALRHLFQHLGGEETDPESGLPHLSHAAWSILAVQQLKIDEEQAQ